VKSRVVEAIALVVCVAVVATIGIARDARRRAENSTFSTYDTGRNGYRALYGILVREGVTVERFERPLGLLGGEAKTLVISDNGGAPSPAAPGRPSAQMRQLAAFVTRGGRLVALAADLGGGDDALLGLPQTKRTPARTIATRASTNALTAGVAAVGGDFATAFPFQAKAKGAKAPVTALLRTPDGLAAVAYPFGKGEVIAIVAPTVFSNAYLGQAQNARFAYNVLAAGGGTVAFDERVHGYAEDRTLWEALPAPARLAFWICLAVVALALIEANVRFAPAVPVDPPDERDSSAYVASMAALLRRARAARAAVERFADDSMRRARRRYGLSASDGIDRIAPRIDRDDVRVALAQLDRLRDVDRPDDRTLVLAAQLNSRLRKDLA
jgi:hypothetical protein